MKEKIGKAFLFLLLSLLGISGSAVAQEAQKPSPWYVGVQGGVPFGVSTFSSFGADKTRAGFTGGLYGGYRFNPVLSAEISMKWGKTALSAQDCCVEKGYWLGADGIRYNTPVPGMEGYSYADVMSRVSLQQYGLHLHVNLLGLFASTHESRWSLNLSPAFYAVGTKATLRTISTDARISKGTTDWHPGVGGNVMAEYHFTRHFSLGIYSGVNYMTGKRIDGAPEYRHENNHVWESGLRLGWSFGSKSRKRRPTVEPVHMEPAPTVTEAVADTVQPQPAASKTTGRVEVKAATSEPTRAELNFPTIYFSFDSTSIGADQSDKLRTTRQMLEQNPDANIVITGWGDAAGGVAVNRRYSLRRAQAVKQWLVKRGVTKERIEIVGGGIDRQATDNAEARRAQIKERRK